MQTNMKRLQNLVQLCLDLCCLKLVWEFSIQARIWLNPFMAERVTAAQSAHWTPPIALIFPLWLLVSFRFRMYRVADEIRFWKTLVSAFENAALITTLTALATFSSREFGDLVSRMFVPLLFPVAFVLFVFSRYLNAGLTYLARGWWNRGWRVALVGDWQKVSQLMGNMPNSQANAFVGLILPAADGEQPPGCTLPVLGTTSQLAEIINRERLDQVVVVNASLSASEIEHCTQVFNRMGVPVSCAVESSIDPVRMDIATHYGVAFIEMIPVHFTRRQELIKRGFDVVVSAIALLFLAPLMVLIAAVIKCTSQGPVLYRSSRVGRGGRQFTFLKFRSMYVNSDRSQVANEKGGHIFKMRNDPRVTPIGRFLRRYSLDELPQFINVLLGEMSIVGPRPLPAADLRADGMSDVFSNWASGRAKVHPGLTGLWQISGRSDLNFEDMVRLDLAYIQSWSLALDIKIIMHTPMLVLTGVGAY
jgi:exopolysaccharide biosynthesis polyprenyl glycosylphosphotransferase